MSTELTFTKNLPLDLGKLATRLSDRADLFLVWPIATWPLDHNQWRAALAPDGGHRSYYIYVQSALVGHAALRKTESFGAYNVSFMYLAPAYRSHGLGLKVLRFLDDVAMHEIGASTLNLVVRDYNPRALKCYLKAGFSECARHDTAITMTKSLHK